MTRDDFELIIKEVVSHGIVVTVVMGDSDETIWYDLDTQMRSNMRIAFINDECLYYKDKWQSVSDIEDLDDLLDEVMSICDTDAPCNWNWLLWLEKTDRL